MSKVETVFVGDAWSNAEPGSDPVLYGQARISPEGAFEARSLQTFEITYTAGRFGLDDTGGIKVVTRYSNDWGRLQTDDPWFFCPPAIDSGAQGCIRHKGKSGLICYVSAVQCNVPGSIG